MATPFDDSRRCTVTKRDGVPCKVAAIRGGTVCVYHGGQAPQVRAAANRRLLEREVTQLLAEQGIQAVDPLTEFASLCGEVVAFKELMGEIVAELDSYRYKSDHGNEQLRAEVVLYTQAQDRAGKFLAEWVKLGLDERIVRVQERQAEIVAKALDLTLAELGLDQSDAREVLGRHLRAIEAA